MPAVLVAGATAMQNSPFSFLAVVVTILVVIAPMSMSMSMSMSTVDFYSASPHPPLMRWVPKFTFYTEGWPG